MSKLIECDKCKILKNAFGCVHLINDFENEKYIICDECNHKFEKELNLIRSFLINNFIQSERSKREDYHLTINDIANDITHEQLMTAMQYLERKLIDAD